MRSLARSIAIPLALLALLCTTLFGSPSYAANDLAPASGAMTATRYVWAKALFLRAQPDGKSEALARIPYGSSLNFNDGDAPVAHSEVFGKYTIEGKTTTVTLDGAWRKTHWQDKDGWVFDAYVSRYPAPDDAALKVEADASKNNDMLTELVYAKHVFGPAKALSWVSGDSRKSASFQAMQKYFKDAPLTQEKLKEWGWLQLSWQSGAIMTRYSGYDQGGESGSEYANLPLTFNEAVLWVTHFQDIPKANPTTESGVRVTQVDFEAQKTLSLDMTDDNSVWGPVIECSPTSCTIREGASD